MNPVSRVSSHRGIAPPLEAGGKSKETGSTKKVPEGVAGGHSVSPAADGNAFPVALAGQAASVTEPAGHTLQCRETASKATPEAALAIPVDRTDPAQTRLHHKSEIINKPGKSDDQAQTETRRSIMYKTMVEAGRLTRDGKLEEANKKLEPVLTYAIESGDGLVIRDLFRSMAYISYYDADIDNALAFFCKARQHGSTITDFPEKLLVQQLTLARGTDSARDRAQQFNPEFFYREIKEWLSTDKTREKKLEEIIEDTFKENASQVKIFRNGIKIIFDEEDVLVAEKFEHVIAELSKPRGNQSRSWTLDHLPDMLKFARNLRLIEKGYLQEALKKVASDGEDYEFQYLNEYIRCQVLKENGKIDQAIEVCEQGSRKGYPFTYYLIRLRAEKTTAEHDAREYEPACGIPA